MKKYLNFINESNDNGILVICDLQKEFSKFIPQKMVESVMEYCNNFHTVYQIWDGNKNQSKPSYNFPNEKGNYIKKYGTKFSEDLENTVAELNKKYPNAKEGDKFEFDDVNSYVVKITNNHSWFYVTEKMSQLFNSLKGKNVILIGGAGSTDINFYQSQDGNLDHDLGECIKDVYESMLSFGINVKYDTRYIYNAKTSNSQVFNKNIQNLIK